MTSKIIQVEYATLALVAEQFDISSENITIMIHHLDQVANLLKAGGWEGQGADQFHVEHVEMETDVFPALNRLARDRLQYR